MRAEPADISDLSLAASRAAALPARAVCYALGSAVAAVYMPAAILALCLAAIALAEFVAWQIGRSRVEPTAGDGISPNLPADPKLVLIAVLATEIVGAATLGVLWHFAAPYNKIVPLCMFMVPLVSLVQVGRSDHKSIWRQAIYLSVLVGMSGRDMLMNAGPTRAVAEFLAIVTLAAAVLLVSQARRANWLRQMRHETELAAARARANAELEGKSRFIATVSHELRTSLNGVLGMAQTLLSSDLDPRQRQQAEVIAESGRSLNTLLNDILDYSKLEVGKLTIEAQPEDLRQSVEHIAWLHGPAASEKGLELRVEVGPDVPEQLMIDAVRVRQCLSNLVSNAIKFTDEGSVEISLSSEQLAPGDDGAIWYLITAIVADTGIGIAPERAKTLFQPFTQADGTISRRFGGTGLGLSITRQLAESMGGSVTLDSVPGEGTTFRLSFRAQKVDGAEKAATDADLSHAFAGKRILIADDVATNRIVMRLCLKPLGADVREAEDGMDALAALEEDRFDAALLDINMPGIGGASIAQRLREAGKTDVALIAISGESSPTGSGTDGFDAILTKPINPDQLKAILTGAIERRAGRLPGSSDSAPS